MHANYFINVSNATSADVVELMQTVRARVHDRWGIMLGVSPKLRLWH